MTRKWENAAFLKLKSWYYLNNVDTHPEWYLFLENKTNIVNYSNVNYMTLDRMNHMLSLVIPVTHVGEIKKLYT